MSSEIISALISAAVALIVSYITAKKEIKKMRLEWEREDHLSAEDELANMASAVSSFISRGSEGYREQALSKVASARSKEAGPMAEALDSLYYVLSMRPCSFDAADAALTRVINEGRNQRDNAESDV
ncbi:MAG: hypothetical protein ACI4V3_05305 [Faecousia sp.]